MPEFTFDGPTAHDYPELRHSDGSWAGTVQPGDIRDLAGAPDHMWRETTDEDRAALPAITEARQRAADEEKFTRLLRQLTDMGLDEALLGKLAEAGVTEGLPAAEGLTAGGMAAVQQVNAEQAAMAAASVSEPASPRPARARTPRSGDQPAGPDTAGGAGGEES
jgi:hypothetical protein